MNCPTLELGFDKIILEGDYETVIKALTDPSPSLASYGLLIQEAQQLATQLNGISFQHLGREGNKVAHNLARHARYVTGLMFGWRMFQSFVSMFIR